MAILTRIFSNRRHDIGTLISSEPTAEMQACANFLALQAIDPEQRGQLGFDLTNAPGLQQSVAIPLAFDVAYIRPNL